MIEAILSCDCDSECTDPNSHLRLLTRKGGRDHRAIDRRPLPRITFGGTSSGRALCPQADRLAVRLSVVFIGARIGRRSVPCVLPTPMD